MKAIRATQRHSPDRRGRTARLLLAGAMLVMLGSCAGPEQGPAPITAAPRPEIALPPPPVAATTDWRDAPITPGDWSWIDAASGSTASFGDGTTETPLLALRCDLAAHSVMLLLANGITAPATLTITTSTQQRSFTLAPAAARAQIAVRADDPLLDAMAFSRGRFAVEEQGFAPLYLPSWPEVARVVEDCRKG